MKRKTSEKPNSRKLTVQSEICDVVSSKSDTKTVLSCFTPANYSVWFLLSKNNISRILPPTLPLCAYVRVSLSLTFIYLSQAYAKMSKMLTHCVNAAFVLCDIWYTKKKLSYTLMAPTVICCIKITWSYGMIIVVSRAYLSLHVVVMTIFILRPKLFTHWTHIPHSFI